MYWLFTVSTRSGGTLTGNWQELTADILTDWSCERPWRPRRRKVEAWLHGMTKNQQQRKRGSTSTNAWGQSGASEYRHVEWTHKCQLAQLVIRIGAVSAWRSASDDDSNGVVELNRRPRATVDPVRRLTVELHPETGKTAGTMSLTTWRRQSHEAGGHTACPLQHIKSLGRNPLDCSGGVPLTTHEW